MVRHCAIPDCRSNDQTTLCHRFPKRKEYLEKWRHSLRLDRMDPVDLFNRYVVCTLHFAASDYRNAASRMLNSMAVPTLSVFLKGKFYDAPTMICNAGKMGKPRANQSKTVSKPEPIPQASEIEVLEVQEAEPEGRTVIETVEPVANEFEVYYIEEEAHKDVAEEPEPNSRLSESLEIEVLDECPPEEVEEPPVKRKCTEEEPEEQSTEQSPAQQVTSRQDVAAQTDEDPEGQLEDQLDRRLVAEQYPEYANLSRLEMAKRLKESVEELAEVKKKLAHIEAAHAVVREAFKSIMN